MLFRSQQFTVDPRLLSAISTGGKVDIASDSEPEPDSDDEPVVDRAQKRKELLEKLSAEYDAEVAKGCLSCGS